MPYKEYGRYPAMIPVVACVPEPIGLTREGGSLRAVWSCGNPQDFGAI